MATLLDRLLGRPEPPVAVKAATGAGVVAMTTLPNLTTLFGNSPQDRMTAFLKAYKVGWFYKAESKISGDLAGLGVHVSPENDAGENEMEIIEPDLFTPWERLDPVGQFLRLMERPNPNQTGRQLRQKTQIRLDMAGAAFWYLESPLPPYGLPLGIHGISPARMWKVEEKGVLIGWIMDRNKPGGGVPFQPSEILPFMAGSADDDGWGVGVVESVFSQLTLTDLMARHVADVLSSGGRLAGAMWPKNRTLDEAEFVDAQRAWRSVTSDPNAAKRLLMFPEPMEWTQGSATPSEIGIPELAALNRDEILTAFPISPYQLGVPMPGGLNSAETRREDRRDYWEGTIHPRVELFEEAVQVGLLSRYEAAVGYTLDFEVEEPNMIDSASIIERAGAMTALKTLGFDDKEAVKAVGLDFIKYNGPPPEPAMPDQALTIVANDSSRRDQSQTTQPLSQKPTEAKAEDIRAHRDRVVAPLVDLGSATLTRFFTDQRQRVSNRIRETLPAKVKSGSVKAERAKADPDAWWDQEQEDEALRSTVRALYVEVGKTALQTVADQVNKFVSPNAQKPIVNDLLTYGADRVTSINENTRLALRQTVALGVSRGYNLDQLIDGVPAERYPGVQKALLDNGVPVFGDARAEMIARTETALSYNRASLGGYREFGIREVIAHDGDGDYECSVRNGQPFPVDDAYSIADHPNGTLDWSPVINFTGEEKALTEADHWRGVTTKALDALAIPQPAPVIHIHNEAAKAPDVKVEMAPITVPVTLPEMPPAVVNVTLPEPKAVRKTVERDDKGAITGMIEEPV